MKTLLKFIFKVWCFIIMLALFVEAAPILIFIYMMTLIFGGTERFTNAMGRVASRMKRCFGRTR
jgi:hypothetical protein